MAPTPLGTHEHSRAHFSILRLRTPSQGVPKGLEQPHEKKGGDLEIGTWPRLKCTFYEQNWASQSQPYSSRSIEGEAEFGAATRKERLCFAAECGLGRLGHTGTPNGLEQPHEKNGPVLLRNVAPTPLGTHEHSRVHFSILRLRIQFRAATRKERPCFAAECGFGSLGHTGTLEALEQPHEKNGPALLQNVAPTPLGTHEHSRAHFSILRLRTPNQGVPKGLEQPHEKKGGDLEIGTWPRLKCAFYEQNLVSQNQPYFSRFMEGEAEFRAATRKQRLCFAAECGRDPGWFRAATRKELPSFAAECGPDPFGHTRALEGPFFDPRLISVCFKVR